MRDTPARIRRSLPELRRAWKAVACGAALLFAGPSAGPAQEPGNPDPPAVPGDSSLVSDSIPRRDSRLVPYPVLFYTPETGIGFGVGAVWFFRTPGSRLSSVSPRVFYTAKNQFSVSAALDAWLDSDAWKVFADVGFSRFPAKFWGIGNETPDEAEEDYTPRSAWLRPRVEHRVTGSLYAGIFGSLLARELVETTDDGSLAAGALPGTEPLDLVSVGLSASFDSRDDVVNPARGMLHRLAVERFPEWLGSDFEYTAWTADLRGYLPLGDQVLAGRLLFQGVDGTVPFDRLPQLGGERLLRGTYEGRYRDDVLVALQAEARIRVWRRFGVVGFVAAGQVAPRPSELDLGDFHPSGGVGIRYMLSRDQKLNIRIDFALAEGSTGLYFNLGEAF